MPTESGVEALFFGRTMLIANLARGGLLLKVAQVVARRSSCILIMVHHYDHRVSRQTAENAFHRGLAAVGIAYADTVERRLDFRKPSLLLRHCSFFRIIAPRGIRGTHGGVRIPGFML